MVRAVDVVGVAETLRLCGLSNRATLIRWRKREVDPFPRPIRKLRSGEVWDAAQVRAWLAENRTEDE